jgi:hypothetical protein
MRFITSSNTRYNFLNTHTAHKNVIFLSTECDYVYTVLCTDTANKKCIIFHHK